mgnify:FL=1
MSVDKTHMERVTITLPPELLERIDQDRARAGGKRSTYIVKLLRAHYRRQDRSAGEGVRGDLVAAMRTPEFREILREVISGQDTGAGTGEEEGAGEMGEVHTVPVTTRAGGTGHRRARGDSIPVTEDMKELMRAFMDNPDRPVRSELRRDYQVDTSDLPRWISGEKPRMRKDTWERVKPILEQFAVR